MKKMLCVAVSLCGAALSSLASAQAAPDQRVLLTLARQSYYGLRSQGLTAFQCNIKPDWNVLLADQRKQDAAGADRAIATLSQILFSVSLSPDGEVQLTHNDLPGQSPQMKAALAQIYGGMEQMTTGFFNIWKLFVLSSPFPAAGSEYRVEAVGLQYRLSYKGEPETDVVTMMDRAFAISDLRITTPEFFSTIQPSFTKTPKGLLLNGFESHYQSKKAEETANLKVRIAYQEVEHLQMLDKLDLSGTYGGGAFAVRLTFSDCQVTKKPSSRDATRP